MMWRHIRAHPQEHPTHVLMQLDFRNAFGTLRREACIVQLAAALGGMPAWLGVTSHVLTQPVVVANPLDGEPLHTYDGIPQGGPRQDTQEDHISPAGSSRYHLMSSPAEAPMDCLLQGWQDGQPEEEPQLEEDENQAVADAQQEDPENQAVADDYFMLATPEQRTMASLLRQLRARRRSLRRTCHSLTRRCLSRRLLSTFL